MALLPLLFGEAAGGLHVGRFFKRQINSIKKGAKKVATNVERVVKKNAPARRLRGPARSRRAEARKERGLGEAALEASQEVLRKAPYGSVQIGQSAKDIVNGLSAILTWLTGDAPYGDTNSMIFQEWSSKRNRISSYSLTDDGTLYKHGARVHADTLARESSETLLELVKILGLLAQANADRYKEGIQTGAAFMAGSSGSYKGSKQFLRGRQEYTDDVFGDIVAYFNPLGSNRHDLSAYIHYDPVGNTFDLGPRDYIMAKRAMGAVHGAKREDFAQEINKYKGIYYDYSRGRLTFEGVDTDYVPFKLKEQIGALIYKDYFRGHSNWHDGDRYGWYNIGPRPSRTPTPRRTQPPATTPWERKDLVTSPPRKKESVKAPTPKRSHPVVRKTSATAGLVTKTTPPTSARPLRVKDDFEKKIIEIVHQGRDNDEKKQIRDQFIKTIEKVSGDKVQFVTTKKGEQRIKWGKDYISDLTPETKKRLLSLMETAERYVKQDNDNKARQAEDKKVAARKESERLNLALTQSRWNSESKRRSDLAATNELTASRQRYLTKLRDDKLTQAATDSRLKEASDRLNLAATKLRESISKHSASKSNRRYVMSLRKSSRKAAEEEKLFDHTFPETSTTVSSEPPPTTATSSQATSRVPTSVAGVAKATGGTTASTAVPKQVPSPEKTVDTLTKILSQTPQGKGITGEWGPSKTFPASPSVPAAQPVGDPAKLAELEKKLSGLSDEERMKFSEWCSAHFQYKNFFVIDEETAYVFLKALDEWTASGKGVRPPTVPPTPSPTPLIHRPATSAAPAQSPNITAAPATATAEPTKAGPPKVFARLDDLYNKRLNAGQRVEFGKWLNATAPDIFKTMTGDLDAGNAGVLCSAIEEWLRAQPTPTPAPRGKIAQAVGDVAGAVVAAPFELIKDAGGWVFRKVVGQFFDLSTPEPTPSPTPVPTLGPMGTAYTVPGRYAAKQASRALFRASKLGKTFQHEVPLGESTSTTAPTQRVSGGQVVTNLFPTKTTQRAMPRTGAPPRVPSFSTTSSSASKSPTSASASASQTGTTASMASQAASPTIPEVVKSTLAATSRAATRAPAAATSKGTPSRSFARTAMARSAPPKATEKKATGLGFPGAPAGQPGARKPQGDVPKMIGNYTKADFERGVTSRIVDTKDVAEAVKTINDNLLSIYPGSSFYIYSRKMSSNLFRKQGYRFANGVLERIVEGEYTQPKEGEAQEEVNQTSTDQSEVFNKTDASDAPSEGPEREPDTTKWQKVTPEELAEVAGSNPELFEKISKWSTILSAANYAQDHNMPHVYEGLLTAYPELLEMVKEANADEEIKSRITFNVGASRLTVEPKSVGDLRKFLAGISESDREFLRQQGLVGNFPIIITKRGELLYARNINKVTSALPLHRYAPQVVKAAISTAWNYMKANGIVSDPKDQDEAKFDRIDPTQFKPDPNAEPYENEEFMKNRPKLNIPDKEFPEMMQREEPAQRSPEEEKLHRAAIEDASTTILSIEPRRILGEVNAMLHKKQFGSGDETRKWFEMHGIHDITLDSKGDLIGNPHGHQHTNLALAQIFRVAPGSDKTFAELFGEWVGGLKNQDNRPDDIPNDFAHIEDLLAGHTTDTHHRDFRGEFTEHPEMKKWMDDDRVPPRQKPHYGRSDELYNEKNQFNINPTYWKKFIYLAQLANNRIRTEGAAKALQDLIHEIKVTFAHAPQLEKVMIEHALESRLGRHVRYSNNGFGDKEAKLRDDAPPQALGDIEMLRGDIAGLRTGYPQAQKDVITKSITRMGLTLGDIYKFAEEHPDMIQTPAYSGIEKYGKGLFTSYRIKDAPGSVDNVLKAVDIITGHYATIMPEKLSKAGIIVDPNSENNFGANQLMQLGNLHLAKTHSDKDSTVWDKNEAGKRAEFMFNSAPLEENNLTDWKSILGTPIEDLDLDTDLIVDGVVTPAGWTFLNKYFEPITSHRGGHRSSLLYDADGFERSVDKHQMKNTNTRLIEDSTSLKTSKSQAGFETIKKRLMHIAKDNNVDLSKITDKNGTLSLYKCNEEFQKNPNAMRDYEQLLAAMDLGVSQKASANIRDIGSAEYTREEAILGLGEAARYVDMTWEQILALPWREAILAMYVRACAKDGRRPELTYIDWLIEHGRVMNKAKLEKLIKEGDVEGLINAFQSRFLDPKGELYKKDWIAYNQWLKDNGIQRRFFGEGQEPQPDETKAPPKAPPKPTPGPSPTPGQQVPGQPEQTGQQAGRPGQTFKPTPTGVEHTAPPTPVPPFHPATPTPVNMGAPMGQSVVNANQPWQMGQQNANLGSMPNPMMRGMGNTTTSAQPNMEAQQGMGAQQPPTPNPFRAQQQPFTPPQAGGNRQAEAEAIKNAFAASKASRGGSVGVDREDLGTRQDATSPDWVSQAAKEGGPAGTNEKLWRLINWLKNKSLENIEDQHKLINQGSAGRAMLKGATDLVKGRPWYYKYVSERKPEAKSKR